jgi:hypothetical protein
MAECDMAPIAVSVVVLLLLLAFFRRVARRRSERRRAARAPMPWPSEGHDR